MDIMGKVSEFELHKSYHLSLYLYLGLCEQNISVLSHLAHREIFGTSEIEPCTSHPTYLLL